MDPFYIEMRPKNDSCIPGKMSTNEFSKSHTIDWNMGHVNAFDMVFDPQTDASIAVKKIEMIFLMHETSRVVQGKMIILTPFA